MFAPPHGVTSCNRAVVATECGMQYRATFRERTMPAPVRPHHCRVERSGFLYTTTALSWPCMHAVHIRQQSKSHYAPYNSMQSEAWFTTGRRVAANHSSFYCRFYFCGHKLWTHLQEMTVPLVPVTKLLGTILRSSSHS